MFNTRRILLGSLRISTFFLARQKLCEDSEWVWQDSIVLQPCSLAPHTHPGPTWEAHLFCIFHTFYSLPWTQRDSGDNARCLWSAGRAEERMSVPSSEPLSSKAKEGGSAKDSPEGKLVASTLGNYSSGAQPPPSLPSWKKDLGAGEKPGQGPRSSA